MCNRYLVSAKQPELAKRYGFDVDKLMPEPDLLPPPELFPKKPGWIVRKQDGALSLDVMQWGIPRHMKGKSGKPITSYITERAQPGEPLLALYAGQSALSLPRARDGVLRVERREGIEAGALVQRAGRPGLQLPRHLATDGGGKSLRLPHLRSPLSWSRSMLRRCR